jgi:hypothetical protein
MKEGRESRMREWRGARDWQKGWQVHICGSHIHPFGNIFPLTLDLCIHLPIWQVAWKKTNTLLWPCPKMHSLLPLSALWITEEILSSYQMFRTWTWQSNFPTSNPSQQEFLLTPLQKVSKTSEFLFFLYLPLSYVGHLFLCGCMLWPPPCSGCFYLSCCYLCSNNC